MPHPITSTDLDEGPAPGEVRPTSPSATVQISFFDDRANRSWSVDGTPELLSLIEYAHGWTLVGQRDDDCTLSFSSMLAALVTGRDTLCKWLRRHLALRGVPAQLVTRGRSVGRQQHPDKLWTTFSFRQAEAEATRLAAGEPLDVRHFMAAYAVVPDYHREDFLRLRIDRRAWCLGLAEQLQREYPNEREAWAAYAERAPMVLLPGFDADLPGGADLLGIGREVEAFAMLVAGRDTRTPLSIGVFGAWGSGKTFFMRELQDRVTALATRIETNPRYLRKVAQVRFNAWHYSETNVVASMVDQILRNLRFEPSDTERELADRQQQALREIGAAEQLRAQREIELARAIEEEKQAQAELDRLDAEVDAAIEQKTSELAETRAAIGESSTRLLQITEDQVRALEAAGVRASDRRAALVEQVLEGDPELARLGSDLRQVTQDVRWVGLKPANIAWGAVILLLTAVAAFAFDAALVTAAGVIAAVAPAAGTALKLLREVADKGHAYDAAVQRRVEEERERVSVEAERARAAEEQERSRLEAALEAIRADVTTLEQRSSARAGRARGTRRAAAPRTSRGSCCGG